MFFRLSACLLKQFPVHCYYHTVQTNANFQGSLIGDKVINSKVGKLENSPSRCLALGLWASRVLRRRKMSSSYSDSDLTSSEKRNGVVAVCQMTSTSNKDNNFATCRQLIEKAVRFGAQMVFLPECFDYVGSDAVESKCLAEPVDGELITKYRQLAKQLNVWLSLGGFHEKRHDEDPRLSNTHVVVNNQGDISATYCKTHLYDYDNGVNVSLCESKVVKPGTCIIPPVATPVGRVGLGVCYDLRFPEFSTALTQLGAEILTYPSNFTVPTGLAHWEVLLRSRAIENQCYVIAAAQTGKNNDKRLSYGHAMVVDPWGAVVAQCHEGTDVCFAHIDLDYVGKVRQQMPLQLHRRHDLYGRITPLTKAPCEDSFSESYKFGQHWISSDNVFYKSALSYAFVNRKPVVPGHVLISPFRLAKKFADLTPDEVSDMFVTSQTVSKVLERHYKATALTIAIQDGADAGQTVEHVHVHVLPRKPGDFDENDTVYQELATHDKDDKGRELPENSPQFRSTEDMRQEAMTLRTLFS